MTVDPTGIERYSFSTLCGYFTSLTLVKSLTKFSIPATPRQSSKNHSGEWIFDDCGPDRN
jgi:hypothetical protein